MTRYTVMLLQEAYPEQIRIDRHKNDKTGKINIECYLLNEDKTPHMLLFDGGSLYSCKSSMRAFLFYLIRKTSSNSRSNAFYLHPVKFIQIVIGKAVQVK